MRRVQTMIGLVLIAIAFYAAPAAAQATGPTHSGYDPTVDVAAHVHEGDLGDKLMILETSLKCQCSCGLDLHMCQFSMQCGESPVWSRRIMESLEAGESVEAIQASFVSDFGTEVLMLPPPEGFNLLGYFLPAVAIVTAGMLVGLLVRGRETVSATAPVTQLSTEDEDRLRRAMTKLDQEEGPDW